MGMDVYGKAPITEEGKYFRNNCWWWRPLADYACQVAPEITAKCEHWQTNDGDGLDEEDSIRLAIALQAEIDSGRCAEFAAAYMAEIKALPKENC